MSTPTSSRRRNPIDDLPDWEPPEDMPLLEMKQRVREDGCIEFYEVGGPEGAETETLHFMIGQKDFHQVPICVLGDPGVGKTKLINRLAGEDYSPIYKATHYAEETLIEREHEPFSFWDISGRWQYLPMIEPFYFNCEFCLLCFDVTNIKSYIRLKHWRDEVYKVNRACKFIVVGTKCDLHEQILVQKYLADQQAERWRGVNVYTSSKAGTGISQILQAIENMADSCVLRNKFGGDIREMFKDQAEMFQPGGAMHPDTIKNKTYKDPIAKRDLYEKMARFYQRPDVTNNDIYTEDWEAAKQEKIDRGKKGLNAIVEYIRENREEFLQSCQEQEKKPYPNGLTKEMLFADNWD